MGRPELPQCACDYCLFHGIECDLLPCRSCELFQPGPSWANYLNRAHWKTTRIKKLLSVNQCEICGSQDNLQVHHKTYENIFCEPLEDLEVLCCRCHARVRMDRFRQTMWGCNNGHQIL